MAEKELQLDQTVADVGGGGGGGTINSIEDENIAVAGGPHTILNFTGDGVTATNAGGGQVDIAIPTSGTLGNIEIAESYTAAFPENTEFVLDSTYDWRDRQVFFHLSGGDTAASGFLPGGGFDYAIRGGVGGFGIDRVASSLGCEFAGEGSNQHFVTGHTYFGPGSANAPSAAVSQWGWHALTRMALWANSANGNLMVRFGASGPPQNANIYLMILASADLGGYV